MRRDNSIDHNMISLLLITMVAVFFWFQTVYAKDVRTVKLGQMSVARILITPGKSTVLSFPTKPVKVILGNRGVFAVEYVENDLAIAALTSSAKSNLFVYLEGRRFAFDLSTTTSGGDLIVLVRDSFEGTETKHVKGKIK